MPDSLPNVHVRAEVLVQALPHMQRYDEQIVVIKYGGHAMSDRAAFVATTRHATRTPASERRRRYVAPRPCGRPLRNHVYA